MIQGIIGNFQQAANGSIELRSNQLLTEFLNRIQSNIANIY
jgi:hypothetical protein